MSAPSSVRSLVPPEAPRAPDTRKSSRQRAAWHVIAVILTAACGGSDSTGSSQPVATVTVTPNPVSVAVDSTVQLSAALRDAAGNALSGRAISWASSATSTATVDANGLVTGAGAGSASISATSEGITGATALTVFNPSRASVDRAVVTCGAKQGSCPSWLLSPLDDEDDAAWETFEKLFSSRGARSLMFPGLFHPVLELSRHGGVRGARRAEGDQVLFAGGGGSGNAVAVRGATLYDPTTDEVTELEMTAARVYHTLTPLPDGRALVAGGDSGTIGGPGSIQTLSSAEVFDLDARVFTATGSMAEARSRHAAAPLPDGRVLVTGGLVPVGGGPTTIDVASAEIYDPVAGTFSPTGDMTVTRFNHSAIALEDGRVLVLGGNGRSSAEVFDPTTGTFAPLANMEVVHGLGHQAVKLGDGRVLVLGGAVNVIDASAVAEIFDPGTNAFTRVADMTTTRMLHWAVLLERSGKVLTGGGQNAEGDVIASVELFDPVAGTFTPIADMPLPGSEQTAVYIPE